MQSALGKDAGAGMTPAQLASADATQLGNDPKLEMVWAEKVTMKRRRTRALEPLSHVAV